MAIGAQITTESARNLFSRLSAHYDRCFERYGDCAQGMDWPDAEGARLRYGVMADLLSEPGAEVLDLGCGAGHFWEYLQATGRTDLRYRGIDLSDTMVRHCCAKFPGIPFERADVLTDPSRLGKVDYAVLNGVLTEKLTADHDAMFGAARQLLTTVFGAVRRGMAFNVMSKHVDWERDDLFHLPYDDMARFVVQDLSRRHVIRADYGLYEYTVYVFK